ncbi:PadR family transcriptional regulator [Paludicola sp. MB14-C6]|uniref:PadR family transcriptional regulator n=1 Tax=Paludihabitans sp. MB14-C6 TaxID=3070656 RepID=UPI0027DB55CF|nr:PadR family transcriptional regulator [Paludicola sp. MB14-C6]WMJ21949.1 PadR family transcriptional regulator [Paludicola sp. MB14-C6]
MSLRHEILALLDYEEATSYELTKKINSNGLFFWQAQQSQVYRETTKLEKENLIVANPQSANTKKYSLTKEGKQVLVDWLNETDVTTLVEIRNPLLMKVFFSNITKPKDTIIVLQEYVNACKAKLSEIVDGKEDISAFAKDKHDEICFSLTTYYAVSYYNFSIEWAEKCITVLQQL